MRVAFERYLFRECDIKNAHPRIFLFHGNEQFYLLRTKLVKDWVNCKKGDK
jgi:hypothetical protein